MKEFYDLVKDFRLSDEVHITAVVPVTFGYLLSVRYNWTDGSFREEAVFISEEPWGPNKGDRRVGWTHIMHEHTVERD